MWRLFGFVLLGVALSGCASTGGLPSITSIGGSGGQDSAQKSAPAPQPEASSQDSGLGGIWANFSSAFSSGDHPAPAPTLQKVSDDGGLDQNEALRLINEFRASKGFQPLALDSQATRAAQMLARDMAQHDHMSHIGPNGADVGKRLSLAGYSYRIAAENVGVGQKSLAQIIEGWKKSAPHSRNMLLAEAKHIGIAYEYKPDTKHKTFWTLVVAAP
jgi:uncharacterized protein YkwD